MAARHQQLLSDEVAHAETVLREAAAKLLQWADTLAMSRFESTDFPEHLREVAHVLAKQGGRLSMAREMAGK